MSTIGEVAGALAVTINRATGVRATDYVPDDVNPPHLFVALNTLNVESMGLGSVTLRFDCVIFVSRAADRTGQYALYEYLSPTGPKSIIKAVFDTPTLGLADVSASPVSEETRSLGLEELAAYGYYGGVVPVLVATDGA